MSTLSETTCTYAFVDKLRDDSYYLQKLEILLSPEQYKFIVKKTKSDVSTIEILTDKELDTINTIFQDYFAGPSDSQYSQCTTYKSRMLEFVNADVDENLYKKIVISAIKNEKSALRYISPRFLSDFDFAIELLKSKPFCGTAYTFLSDEFQRHPDIINLTLELDPEMIIHIPCDVENFSTYLHDALNRNGLVLQLLPPEMQNDPTLVEIAVDEDGRALEFASKTMQGDKKIVHQAIANKATALKYASPELQDSFDTVLLAVRKNPLALQFASDNMKKNVLIASTAVSKNPKAFKYVSNELKETEDIITLTNRVSNNKRKHDA